VEVEYSELEGRVYEREQHRDLEFWGISTRSEACDSDDTGRNPGKHVNAYAKTLNFKPRLKMSTWTDLHMRDVRIRSISEVIQSQCSFVFA
jgi:hypothetical protein